MRAEDRILPTPIAIDGPAASGKSTVGAALVERFGYAFLDTGLMYRAITLAGIRAGIDSSDKGRIPTLIENAKMRVVAEAETRILLGDDDVTDLLRAPDVEANVSKYSTIPAIRDAMVAMQREVASAHPSVLAGRDIGTVVLPDAPIKVYLEASVEARANRRSVQAGGWGTAQDANAARNDIAGRDKLDSTRVTSPLRPAVDAVIIDTTDISIEETVRRVLELVECFKS
jgi:cytidylate kinase